MGTHWHGSTKERRALDAFIKLERAAESMTSRLAARPGLEGLTQGQFGILEALFHLGPLCQKDLGRKLLRSDGNVTLLVDNLEKRGLVKRVRGEADRRFVSVELTADGTTLIGRVLPGHVAAVVEEMRALSADEQDLLGKLCRRLGRREAAADVTTNRNGAEPGSAAKDRKSKQQNRRNEP